MTYDETIAYLYGLEASLGWDLKLERVHAALEELGSPERRFPSVLIAGTNGKGSTAAMVHAMLAAAGYRVGLYTSPHLVHFTERIRIGEREIARQQVIDLVAWIRSRIERHGLALTFFELTTVLAFVALAEAGVELAVLEVGLGGRLDATNVVEPLVSAITTIGLDHEQYLGSTLDAIAREKAGVMRSGRPVVLGHGLPPEARAALVDEADRTGAVPVWVSLAAAPAVPRALSGEHMRANAASAVTIVKQLQQAALAPLSVSTNAGSFVGARRFEVGDAALQAGVAGVRWPGRLHEIQRDPLVLCDGAHNREGIEALVSALPALVGERRVRLLFGALSDKPWREMATRLLPFISQAVVSRVGGPRGVPAEELRDALAPHLPTTIAVDPAQGLRLLTETDRETPVLVAGSLYLAGAVYADVLARRGLESVFDI